MTLVNSHICPIQIQIFGPGFDPWSVHTETHSWNI